MNENIIKRLLNESDYILKTKKTIREVANYFNVSKSTVHKDFHERLKKYDYHLYLKVDEILKYHIDIRHIRGGEATRKKYKKQGIIGA